MRVHACVCAIGLLLAAPAAIAQENVRETAPQAKWDDEAKKLIPLIVDSNVDFGAAVKHLHSLKCDIGLRVSTNLSPNPMAAGLTYGWEDRDDNGFLSADEVDIETTYVSDRAIGAFVRGVVQGLRTDTTSSVFSIFAKHDVTTRKVGDGYILELRPIAGAAQAGFDRLYVSVAPDGRVTGLKAKNAEGTSVNAEYEYIRFGDKWIRSGQRQRITQAGGEATEEVRRDVYRNDNGIPVLATATIDTSVATAASTVQIHQEYTIQNVQVVRREKALPAPGTVDYEKLFREAKPGGGGPLIEDEAAAPAGQKKPPKDEGPLIEEEQPAAPGARPPTPPPAPGDAGGLFEDEPPEKPATPAPPAAPAQESAELGAEVVDGIGKAYFGWQPRNPGADFAAAAILKEGGRDIASFDLGPREFDVRQVIELSANLADFMTGMSYPWNLFISGPLGRPDTTDRKWTARRTPQGYLLTARDAAGATIEEVVVKENYEIPTRKIQVRQKPDEAPVQFVFDFESREAGGVRYLRKIDMRQVLDGQVLLARTYVFTYQNREEGVFLRRIDIAFCKGEKNLVASLEVTQVE